MFASKKKNKKNSRDSNGPRWVCQEGEIEMKEYNGKMHPNKILSLINTMSVETEITLLKRESQGHERNPC